MFGLKGIHMHLTVKVKNKRKPYYLKKRGNKTMCSVGSEVHQLADI